jgi:hypothetical protein
MSCKRNKWKQNIKVIDCLHNKSNQCIFHVSEKGLEPLRHYINEA